MTNPRIQYLAYPQYALDMKLITKEDQDDINKLMPKCHDAIKTCGTRYLIHFYHNHFYYYC